MIAVHVGNKSPLEHKHRRIGDGGLELSVADICPYSIVNLSFCVPGVGKPSSERPPANAVSEGTSYWRCSRCHLPGVPPVSPLPSLTDSVQGACNTYPPISLRACFEDPFSAILIYSAFCILQSAVCKVDQVHLCEFVHVHVECPLT